MKIFHFTELRVKTSQNYTHMTLCNKRSCDPESFFSGTILEQNNLMTQNIYQNMKVHKCSSQINFACDGLYIWVCFKLVPFIFHFFGPTQSLKTDTIRISLDAKIDTT